MGHNTLALKKPKSNLGKSLGSSYITKRTTGVGGVGKHEQHPRRCIVPPQPWMDIPYIRMRFITFGWPSLSPYAAWPSMLHGVITFSSFTLVIIWFNLSWTTHGPHHQFISTRSSDILTCTCIRVSAQSCDSYHSGDKVWNVVEDETMEILSGKKVPLRDNRSATHG